VLHDYDLGDEEIRTKPNMKKTLKVSAQNKLKGMREVDRLLNSDGQKGFSKLPKQTNKSDKVYIQKLDKWLNSYS